MMALDNQQRQIIRHFMAHVPNEKQAAFETIVLKAVKDRRDRTGQRTVRACADAMTTLGKQKQRKGIGNQ